ncbi:E3 ubiquitin-protein ligase ATL41-like [Prosopis cineraria]|uniref:E3 ubiquitin-protein ligase ATL41-like n=1 Tax=Prosopis cineraria TaxID=364024 RepID=UPI00240FD571|nr:E3 ubiquitin-protein ligase ATL41-like [Prosopis cineraria]
MGFTDPEDDSLGIGLKVMLAAAFTLFAIIFFIIVFHFYARRLRLSRQLSLLDRRLDDQPVYQFSTHQVLPVNVESSSPNHDRQGLDPSVIASIPKLWYKHTDQFNDGEAVECSVCLATIGEDATVRVLPNCKHVFHVDCVDTWFGTNTTCPICRTVAEPTVPVGGAVQPTAPPELESSGTI